MIFNIHDVDDRDKAEKYLSHPVKTASGTAVLVAIYDDWFETTAGFFEEIDNELTTNLITYDGQHATYLPIDFHYKDWQFEDGSVGKIDHVEFTADVVPGRMVRNIFDIYNKAHECVKETK